MAKITHIKLNVTVHENSDEGPDVVALWANDGSFTVLQDILYKERNKLEAEERQAEKKPDGPFKHVMRWLGIDTSKMGIVNMIIGAIKKVLAVGHFSTGLGGKEFRLTLVKNAKKPEYTVE
jgi:hypothetical protein